MRTHSARVLAASIALLLTTAGMASAGPLRGVDKSPNVKKLETIKFRSKGVYATTDIAFSGRRAFVGGSDGLTILDLSAAMPRKVGFLPCPGDQNDVAVVSERLVVLGYHQNRCAPTGAGGITLVDVSDSSRPRVISSIKHPGGGVHTLTVYPETSYIYASPGGTGPGVGSNAPSPEIIYDVSDPAHPKIVARFFEGVDCHDLTFRFTRTEKLAVCAGGFNQRTQIWDVSDPLRPKVISEITNPVLMHHHLAVLTPDAKTLVLGDEAQGVADCGTASLWVYDTSDLANPQLVGRFALPPGRTIWNCTPHNFNFIPGSEILVSAWYNGGMDAVDFSDPAQPQEIAHYVVDGAGLIFPDETVYWSAYWYDGKIFATDMYRGVDIFTVKGLEAPLSP